MKFWIMIFSAALFAGGTCLGVALQPKLAPKPPAPARAPESGWEGHRGEFSVTRFVSELGLSEEQDRQLDTVLADTQRDVEAYGRAMRLAQSRSKEKVMEILTDEQKKKLDELMAAEREKRGKAEIDRKVAAYTKILGLDETETQGISRVFADARARRHEYFKQRHDHSQTRAFFKSLREDQNKAIESVLAPEHFKRYLELLELERY